MEQGRFLSGAHCIKSFKILGFSDENGIAVIPTFYPGHETEREISVEGSDSSL